jgi:hypothetical protein
MPDLQQVMDELKRVAADTWAAQTVLLCLIARSAEESSARSASLTASIDDAANLLEQLAAVAGSDGEKYSLARRTVEQMRLAADAQRRLPS